jgi:predicted DNA-binding protein (MmcQ/YjbR family)
MISFATFRKLTLAFPETDETAHFENKAFRVRKKIFVTLNEKENRCFVKLSPVDQSAFCTFDLDVIFPVPNKWGKHGWTLINLKKVKKEMLLDALTTAYIEVAPEKLAKPYSEKRENL